MGDDDNSPQPRSTETPHIAFPVARFYSDETGDVCLAPEPASGFDFLHQLGWKPKGHALSILALPVKTKTIDGSDPGAVLDLARDCLSPLAATFELDASDMESGHGWQDGWKTVTGAHSFRIHLKSDHSIYFESCAVNGEAIVYDFWIAVQPN